MMGHFNLFVQIVDPFQGEIVEKAMETKDSTKTIVITIMGFLYGFAFIFGLFKIVFGNTKVGAMILISGTVIMGLIMAIIQLM